MSAFCSISVGLQSLQSEVAQSCQTLCDPMGYSLPSSSVHGILQARIFQRVAIAISWASSQPRNRTGVSCIVGGFFFARLTNGESCQKKRYIFFSWLFQLPTSHLIFQQSSPHSLCMWVSTHLGKRLLGSEVLSLNQVHFLNPDSGFNQDSLPDLKIFTTLICCH